MKQTSYKVGDYLIFKFPTGNVICLLLKINKTYNTSVVLILSDDDPDNNSRYPPGRIKEFSFNAYSRKYV